MSIKMTDPVVQIVDRNKQDVWRRFFSDASINYHRQEQDKAPSSKAKHSLLLCLHFYTAEFDVISFLLVCHLREDRNPHGGNRQIGIFRRVCL